MRGKPLLPYAVIAVVGLILMVGLSLMGVGQKEARIAAEADGGQQVADSGAGDTSAVGSLGEQQYKATCIGCHGANFDGPMGNLNGIGDRRSKEEIVDIIVNGGADYGYPAMPAYKDNSNVDAEAITEYLIENAR